MQTNSTNQLIVRSIGEQYLSSIDAAHYLGYSPYSLRRSRFDNMLAGVTPPAYIKRGSRVFYHINELDQWLAQFQPQTCTAQASTQDLAHKPSATGGEEL